MIGLALVVICAWVACARASDWIVTNGLAYHLERGKNYNWLTAGVGFEKSLGREDVRMAGGFYLNSNRDWSSYLAAAWLPLAVTALEGTARLGFLAGGATGYRQAVTPAGGLIAAYEQRQYGFNGVFIPPIESSPGVLWLQFKTRW